MKPVAVAALIAGALLSTGAAALPDRPEPAFRMTDPEVTESSGLAISRSAPGLAYTVNDSGGGPRVYAIDMDTGDVVGVTRLAGVNVTDVEALANGPGRTLVVADVGDNAERRQSVVVHIIDEPRPGNHAVTPRSVRLSYADGARDAEGAFVLGEDLVVVSKQAFGAGFYTAPVFAAGGGEPVRLRRVGDAPALVTDATLLADGRAVVRSYGWGTVVRPAGWESLGEFRFPPMQQAESLAAAVAAPVVYAGSEGSNSPVYRVAVPPLGNPSMSDQETSESAGSAPSRREAEPEDSRLQANDPPAPPSRSWLAPGVVLAVLVAIGAIIATSRRHR